MLIDTTLPMIQLPATGNGKCGLLEKLNENDGKGFLVAASNMIDGAKDAGDTFFVGTEKIETPQQLLLHLTTKPGKIRGCAADVRRALEALKASPALVAAVQAAAADQPPAVVAQAVVAAGGSQDAAKKAAAIVAAAPAAAAAETSGWTAQEGGVYQFIGGCAYTVCKNAKGERVLCKSKTAVTRLLKNRKCSGPRKTKAKAKRSSSGGRRRKSVKRGSYRRSRGRNCAAGFRRSRSGKTCLRK